MTDIIKLENKIVEKSKIIACKIEEKNLRKRAFILNIAATTACEYLNSKGINADNQNSLYKISEFVRNFELADIYVGGVRLDIRATFDSSNFSVPKIQEKYDAKPAAYIVLKFDSALKATQVLGFVPADELQTIKTEAEYFIYNTEILKPIDKLKEFVEKTTVKPAIFSSIEHEKVRELAVPFLDAQIAESEKVYFIKHVISCPVCRETFSDMSEFDVIVSQVKNYNELLNDSTLSVFAGNKEEIDSTILGSLATVENAEENAEENYEEEQENESLTDNLQEENEENPEDEENTENLEENQQDSEEDKDAELLEDISEQNSTEEQNTEEAIVLGAIPEILPMGVANIEAKIHENSEINTLESTEETETESISNEDLTDLSEELPALTEIEEVEETAEETEEQKDQDNALANITDSETDSDTLAEEAPLEENIDTLEDIVPLDEEVANLDELSTLEEIETEEEISIVSETSDGNKEQQELAETAIEELDEIDSLEEIKDAETLESDNSEEPILENDSNSIEEPTELEITNEVNNDIDNLENLEIEPLETVESVEEHNELSTLTEETQEENIIPETLENTEDTSIAALTDEEDSDLTGEDTPLSELENLQTDDISDLSENVADIDELKSLSEENTDTETEISDNNIQEPDEISSLEAETDITLEKLDISDSLEPIGEIETLEHDSLSDIGELQEIHPQEELEETVENKAPSEERKPFTLSLEGEEENEPTLKEETNDLTETEDEDISTESQYDYDIQNETAEETQEPVELVYEEEENDNEISENSKEDMSVTDDKEQESDIYGTTEPVDTDKINEEYEENQNTETSTDTDEIQNLLDDDLLALLSDDAEQQNDANENEPQYSQETNNEELISDEVSATVDNNETEHAQASADNPEEDDTIEALFENEEQTNGEQKEFELAQEPVSQKTVNATKKIIVAAVLTLVLAGGGIASWLVNHNKAATENAQNPDEMFMDLQNQKAESDSEGPAISQDINKSMANSFSDKPSAITITKISWQISEKLAQESSVKEYLQTAGKNIQMNLQNDLSNAADVNFNDSIKISVTIAPDNTLKGAQVLESSGSDQIDEIALRSIKNTLKYVSVPKLKDFKSDYFLTLIINF